MQIKEEFVSSKDINKYFSNGLEWYSKKYLSMQNETIISAMLLLSTFSLLCIILSNAYHMMPLAKDITIAKYIDHPNDMIIINNIDDNHSSTQDVVAKYFINHYVNIYSSSHENDDEAVNFIRNNSSRRTYRSFQNYISELMNKNNDQRINRVVNIDNVYLGYNPGGLPNKASVDFKVIKIIDNKNIIEKFNARMEFSLSDINLSLSKNFPPSFIVSEYIVEKY